jgi:hypothetical protein
MITSITAIGGLIGLVISIGLLAWQTRAVAQQTAISNRIAGVSAINEATAGLREVHLLFVTDPGLRSYFYDGKGYPRSKRERDRVRTVAEQLLDVLEDGLCAHRLVPSSGSLEDWTLYCMDMLASSKVLNAVVRERPKYWPELHQMMAEEHQVASAIL